MTTKQTALESATVKRCLSWLNDQPETLARKVHGSVYAIKGEPDIDACARGVCLKIEVKRPGEKPTKIQEHRLREWANAGAIVAVVHSLEELQDLTDATGIYEVK